MSTRSRNRRHPYSRRAQPSGNRGRQRQQNMAFSPAPVEIDLSGCIDLTGNDSLDVGEIIDLTDLPTNQTPMDSEPVVLISPTDVEYADTVRRRDENWRDRFLLQLMEAEERVIRTRTNNRRNAVTEDASRDAGASATDESDDELPEVPFSVPDSSTSNAASTPVKVTCPVCLETDVQIRQNRKLYSTVCGHIFCSTCIRQAIATQHACPTCRKRLTARQIHKIYL